MKITKKFYIGLILSLACLYVYAETLNEQDILFIDKPVISHEDLFFPNQDDENPNKSDVKILSYFLLSSKSGERWATVTFENLSKGQRIFAKQNILAIFANGEKRPPINLKQKFSGNETITLNLNFGTSKFPILSLYTRN